MKNLKYNIQAILKPGQTTNWAANLVFIIGVVFLVSCGSEKTDHEKTSGQEEVTLADDPGMPAEDNGLGIGPVKTVDVSKFDEALAGKGKSVFESKCKACHQLTDQKIVGPGLKGVTQRRKPEWIMNMVLNPMEMTQKDPQAKKLMEEYHTQMTDQDISEPEARALLEFMRQNDGAK